MFEPSFDEVVNSVSLSKVKGQRSSKGLPHLVQDDKEVDTKVEQALIIPSVRVIDSVYESKCWPNKYTIPIWKYQS